MKTCSRCKQPKELSSFTKDRARKDGLRTACRDCNRISPEKARKQRVALQAANPGYYRSPANNPTSYFARSEVRNEARKAALRERNRNRPKSVSSALSSARRAKMLKATPAWADPQLIKPFYQQAAELTASTGVSHCVDHIVPLRSKLVCGFHSQHNLRVISKVENQRKSNLLLPELI